MYIGYLFSMKADRFAVFVNIFDIHIYLFTHTVYVLYIILYLYTFIVLVIYHNNIGDVKN